jgi:hypothetical protein
MGLLTIIRTKRNRIIIIILGLTALFMTDRYLFMDGRIVNNNWTFERGHYIQDPIRFGQHCELRGNTVFFYKTGEELRVVGCYLGQLFLYDFKTKVISRYSAG